MSHKLSALIDDKSAIRVLCASVPSISSLGSSVSFPFQTSKATTLYIPTNLALALYKYMPLVTDRVRVARVT
jgi:hypothetical protein